MRASTSSVNANTFVLPSSNVGVQKSVNGVYRFDNLDGTKTKKRSLYIFDPNPIFNGGKIWKSNTADPTDGTSQVRCRTAQGLAVYSEPLSSDGAGIIGGKEWTLLMNGKASDEKPGYVKTNIIPTYPLPGHPCTAGLFDLVGNPYPLQQMYTCASLKTNVPGFSTPVRGNQCKKWRHVSHGVMGSTITIDVKLGSAPSPFGIYKVTPRRNTVLSDNTMTPALYIYDKLGWDVNGCTYCWNTKVSFPRLPFFYTFFFFQRSPYLIHLCFVLFLCVHCVGKN